MKYLKVVYRVIALFLPAPVVRALNPARPSYRGAKMDAGAYNFGVLHTLMSPLDKAPDLAESRKMLRDSAGLMERKASIRTIKDIQVDGADGPLKARLYSDSDAPNQPAIVYYHGGGFVMGDLESHHHLCAKLAKFWGGTVISVDYGLGPERPFPAGPRDAVASYLSIIANAESLGIDPTKTGVGGDSAGGTLSTIVCQSQNKDGGVQPLFQILIYPMTDGSQQSQSRIDRKDDLILASSSIDFCMKHYVQEDQDLTDPEFSPAFGTAITGMPPAYVVTGGFDPLMDEGQAYADTMEKAGVAVTRKHYPEQVHGFVTFTRPIPEGVNALRDAANWAKSII